MDQIYDGNEMLLLYILYTNKFVVCSQLLDGNE
jgi:hypothetical protein